METSEQLEELFKQQFERDQEIINETGERLKEVFPDEEQFKVVFDLYQHSFKLMNDVQELNHANIFLNSYVDAFHSILVGEGKLISEEEYREKATEAYTESLKAVNEAITPIQEA